MWTFGGTFATGSEHIVYQMGTCAYGPSSKMASSLACCVICCMMTCHCKIHKFIMLPQAKLYPSLVNNFIFYQKMGILMSMGLEQPCFSLTFFAQMIPPHQNINCARVTGLDLQCGQFKETCSDVQSMF